MNCKLVRGFGPFKRTSRNWEINNPAMPQSEKMPKTPVTVCGPPSYHLFMLKGEKMYMNRKLNPPQNRIKVIRFLTDVRRWQGVLSQVNNNEPANSFADNASVCFITELVDRIKVAFFFKLYILYPRLHIVGLTISPINKIDLVALLRGIIFVRI